jgi:PBP1b-binding outer membrane lipoprotein LpoB
MIIHRKKTILTAFITMALFLTACSGSNTPAVPEENPPSG